MAKKVLLCCPSLACGGIERVVLTITRHFQSNDFQLVTGILRPVVFYSDELQKLKRNHVLIPELPKGVFNRWLNNYFRFASDILQLRKLIRNTQPDILLTFSLEATLPAFFLQRFLKQQRVTWIISEGSNTAEHIKRKLKNKFLVRLVHLFFSKVFNSSHHVTTVSDGLKEQVRQYYKVPSSKITRIYNPVRIQYQQLTIHNKSPMQYSFILGMGRFVGIKGFDLLIEAYLNLSKSTQDNYYLVLCGDGPDRKKLQLKAQHPHIIFHGFTSTPEHFLKYAELIVIPSYLEGFCNTIVEAWEMQCPVISTNCSTGPRELIESGRTGTLVPVGDAMRLSREIQDLLFSKEKQNLYKTYGYQSAKHFYPKIICSHYEALFKFCTSEITSNR